MIDWAYALSLVCMLFGGVTLFSIIILRLTLDRRVRKALPSDKIYNNPTDWYGGFLRSMGFAYATIIERANNYAMKDYYDGFDVKNFATPFEKAICYLFFVSGLMFLVCLFLALITDWFGILEWENL